MVRQASVTGDRFFRFEDSGQAKRHWRYSKRPQTLHKTFLYFVIERPDPSFLQKDESLQVVAGSFAQLRTSVTSLFFGNQAALGHDRRSPSFRLISELYRFRCARGRVVWRWPEKVTVTQERQTSSVVSQPSIPIYS
jgi:hypothetical protein